MGTKTQQRAQIKDNLLGLPPLFWGKSHLTRDRMVKQSVCDPKMYSIVTILFVLIRKF